MTVNCHAVEYWGRSASANFQKSDPKTMHSASQTEIERVNAAILMFSFANLSPKSHMPAFHPVADNHGLTCVGTE